jgi:hypothetical protein
MVKFNFLYNRIRWHSTGSLGQQNRKSADTKVNSRTNIFYAFLYRLRPASLLLKEVFIGSV